MGIRSVSKEDQEVSRLAVLAAMQASTATAACERAGKTASVVRDANWATALVSGPPNNFATQLISCVDAYDLLMARTDDLLAYAAARGMHLGQQRDVILAAASAHDALLGQEPDVQPGVDAYAMLEQQRPEEAKPLALKFASDFAARGIVFTAALVHLNVALQDVDAAMKPWVKPRVKP
jgi:hypothetical protein